ncbi:n-acetylglutamate synthase [Rubricoccus marinus]|uniref:N-acetylglutamate synthase n=1 Tax=Rubricoccus marinus TaxID=716817 RepID=A0A259TWL7_9BACT|nr:n-acetylglutamate synthase [Rubricoccus marinus]OZC02086.1 n-acetylglutamate synthase [Rubricoccus marinus]
MSRPNYDGRRFAPTASGEGDVGEATRFDYRQKGNVVWATYRGGEVQMGTLIATVDARGALDMRYAHVDASGAMRTGSCHSVPEVLPDGRLRLHEVWEWTDGGTGTSTLEEV